MALAATPVSPKVAAHSIIAVEGDGPVETGDDGVVSYKSAHIPEAKSGLVVRSDRRRDRDGSRQVGVPDDLQRPAPDPPPADLLVTAYDQLHAFGIDLPPYTCLYRTFADLVAGRKVPDDPAPATVTRLGFTHVALLCDDVAATRSELAGKGVRFLVADVAEVAGLRTTWFADPRENVFILVEKVRRPERPYYRQF